VLLNFNLAARCSGMLTQGSRNFFGFRKVTSVHCIDRECVELTYVCSDIFSFYKEEIAQETANFIHERAAVTEKSIYAVLFELVDESVMVTRNVRNVLVGDKERNAWERFAAGYLAFHKNTPRYCLTDILSDEDD
jgi:hypothetical protein